MFSRSKEYSQTSTPSLMPSTVCEVTPSHSILDNSPWTAQGVTHDFNNMLSVALSQASVALKKLPPGSTAEENLLKAKRAIENAVDLSHQLMDHFSGVEEKPTRFVLNRLVRKSVELLDPSDSKKLIIHLDLDDGLSPLSAKCNQIQQVIQSLITNAVESIDHGRGTILIESSHKTLLADEGSNYLSCTPLKAGQYVAFQIHDNGIGIKSDQLAHIFERHFTTKKEGRGIGLATVWQIVCEHGGGIKVTSEPKMGSAFEVLLPTGSSYLTNGTNGNHRLF